jgi:hypothetical protein
MGFHPGLGSGIKPFTHRIKKELSICQSFLCLDLVSFPVLSQIKPQAPDSSNQEHTENSLLPSSGVAPPHLDIGFRRGWTISQAL